MEESGHHQQTGEIPGWDVGYAVEGRAAIVVVSEEPAGHNGRIMRVNMTELLIGGEVGAGSDVEMMTEGKEEDRGDEANHLLAKKEPDHVAIGIFRNGVHGEGETKAHGLVVIGFIFTETVGVIIIRCLFAISGVCCGMVVFF